jgi:hypothetical protein
LGSNSQQDGFPKTPTEGQVIPARDGNVPALYRKLMQFFHNFFPLASGKTKLDMCQQKKTKLDMYALIFNQINKAITQNKQIG